MSDCKIYPADTVDIYGNVWPTVGENIRNGIFGEKIKIGKITINGLEITSQDVIISNISNSQFSVNKIVLFFFPISCSKGYLSLRFSIDNSARSLFTSFFNIENTVGELVVIYKEV